jgi:Family of unknown function (DUF5684)
MTTAILNLVSSLPISGILAQADYQTQPEGGGAIVAVMGIVWLLIAVACIAGIWKMFEKAGQPGWAAIVPIYNLIVMLKIAGKPAWWIILLIIPFVGVVFAVLFALALAKSFGKGAGFAIGCVFLGFIFLPMLGFGDAKYIGPQP